MSPVISSVGIPTRYGGGMVSFHWVPSPQVEAVKMDRMAAALNDMVPPITISREVFIAGVNEAFDSKSAPGGAPWAPWSESYAPRARGTLLEDTGEMRSGVTSRGSYMIGARDLFFTGADAPERWIWHQEGRVRSSGGSGGSKMSDETFADLGISEEVRAAFEAVGTNTLPARPFIGMSEVTELKIYDVFDDWFGGIIGGVTKMGQPRLASGRFGSKY